MAGAMLTETTFSWPGMGRLLLERIYLRDYPTIQGVIVVYRPDGGPYLPPGGHYLCPG